MIFLKMLLAGSLLAGTIGLAGSRYFALPEMALERCVKNVRAAHQADLELKDKISDRLIKAELAKFYEARLKIDLLKRCGADIDGKVIRPGSFVHFEAAP